MILNGQAKDGDDNQVRLWGHLYSAAACFGFALACFISYRLLDNLWLKQPNLFDVSETLPRAAPITFYYFGLLSIAAAGFFSVRAGVSGIERDKWHAAVSFIVKRWSRVLSFSLCLGFGLAIIQMWPRTNPAPAIPHRSNCSCSSHNSDFQMFSGCADANAGVKEGRSKPFETYAPGESLTNAKGQIRR